MLKLRRSGERGLADHGWLKSRHTFSFAEYFDPKHMGLGPLRVINEDWIKAGRGFGAHPHRDMEIITYVVKGSLTHQDSLGNRAVIRPDEIQRMTAGTGIIHSELNPEAEQETHLFQIWILPERQGLAPSYGQRSFAEQLATGKPVLVVSRDGRDGSVAINQDADLYITRLESGGTVHFSLREKRVQWLQVVRGSVSLESQTLHAGDAASVSDLKQLALRGEPGTEFLLFDMQAA